MAAKPTAEEAALRILWLYVHKYRLRAEGIMDYRQFLATFPGGRFQASDFKDGAEYALSQGWLTPASTGGLQAFRLTEAGFEHAPESEECLPAPGTRTAETSEGRALRLLIAIHARTLGSEAPVFVTQLAPEVGLSETQVQAAWHYLKDKGLIQTFSIPYTARVNAFGIDAIEDARQYPDQPTPGFGSVTYNTITIHHMEGSSIQQAGAHADLSQSVSYSQGDLDKLREVLNLLEQHLDDLHLDDSAKRKASAQIKTIQAQLVDEPDPKIVAQAGKTLRNVTEGAIGSLIASAVQPSLWKFVGEALKRLFGG